MPLRPTAPLAGPALVLPLLLAGCSSYQPPTLAVTDAYLAQRTDAAAVVHVVLDATNPNTDPMPLRLVAYSASIDGGGMVPTERWSTVSLAGGTTVRFELPVITQPTTVGTEPLRIDGRVEYVPQGRLRALLAELGIPLPTESFSGQTTVDLAAAPRASQNTATRIFGGSQIRPSPTPPGDTLKPLPQ